MVVTEALEWLGTPYVHNARVKGRKGGVDCGQFVWGVFFNVGLTSPMSLDTYPRDFMMHGSEDDYLAIVQARSHEIPSEMAAPGDIVLYRVGRKYAHGAIILNPGWPLVIHSFIGNRSVGTSNGARLMFSHKAPSRRFFSIWQKPVDA